MTTPTTPEPAAGALDKKTGRPATRPVRQRPAGSAGGHSVQDWEQPVQRPGRPSRLEPLESPVEGAAADVEEPQRPERSTLHSSEDPDTPMPAVVPRYLRADGRAGGARPEAVTRPVPPAVQPVAPAGQADVPSVEPFDARRQTLTAQSAALVDALTREISEALAVALRPAIASTVDALIPMILTLGSIPDDEGAGRVPDAVAATPHEAVPVGLPEDGESS